MKPLSAKQRAFVEAYLRCWNGYQAAKEAGYSEASARHQASRMLSYDNIQAAIEARLNELKMSADEVLTRLTTHARGSIADVLRLPSTEPPAEGKLPPAIDAWAIDLVKAQKTGAIHLVKKMKTTKYGTEVELYDAQAALALIGKHHKLFGDDGGILKYLDLSKLTPEQLERLSRGDDPLAVLLDK